MMTEKTGAGGRRLCMAEGWWPDGVRSEPPTWEGLGVSPGFTWRFLAVWWCWALIYVLHHHPSSSFHIFCRFLLRCFLIFEFWYLIWEVFIRCEFCKYFPSVACLFILIVTFTQQDFCHFGSKLLKSSFCENRAFGDVSKRSLPIPRSPIFSLYFLLEVLADWFLY